MASKYPEFCSIEGCEKKSHSRGLCGTHYARWWRTGSCEPAKPVPVAPRPCSVEGCDRPHDSRGFCYVHYRRWLRAHPTDVVLRSQGKLPWLEPTYPPLVAYLEDRRRRGIPREGVLMEGEAA